MAGFRVHYAERAPRKLEDEQSRFLDKLRARDQRQGPLEMPPEIDLLFPGMPGYKGPRRDKPTNVVVKRPKIRKLVS